MDKLKRCGWVPEGHIEYEKYHDDEWGVPVHNDRKHFEMLCLEGAQAGLNWETVLKKKDGYRKVFYNFDVKKCSELTDNELNEILKNPSIIRNKLKVFSIRHNAIAFLNIQNEFGSFDKYIWNLVGGKPIINKFKHISDLPPKTELSDRISKDLKKYGMTFVGSTIIYSYMQAVGIVNDHTIDCFRYKEV